MRDLVESRRGWDKRPNGLVEFLEWVEKEEFVEVDNGSNGRLQVVDWLDKHHDLLDDSLYNLVFSEVKVDEAIKLGFGSALMDSSIMKECRIESVVRTLDQIRVEEPTFGMETDAFEEVLGSPAVTESEEDSEETGNTDIESTDPVLLRGRRMEAIIQRLYVEDNPLGGGDPSSLGRYWEEQALARKRNGRYRRTKAYLDYLHRLNRKSPAANTVYSKYAREAYSVDNDKPLSLPEYIAKYWDNDLNVRVEYDWDLFFSEALLAYSKEEPEDSSWEDPSWDDPEYADGWFDFYEFRWEYKEIKEKVSLPGEEARKLRDREEEYGYSLKDGHMPTLRSSIVKTGPSRWQVYGKQNWPVEWYTRKFGTSERAVAYRERQLYAMLVKERYAKHLAFVDRWGTGPEDWENLLDERNPGE